MGVVLLLPALEAFGGVVEDGECRGCERSMASEGMTGIWQLHEGRKTCITAFYMASEHQELTGSETGPC